MSFFILNSINIEPVNTYSLNFATIFFLLEILIVTSSIASIFWILTKNKFISLLAVPPTLFVILLTKDHQVSNIGFLLLAILVQIIIISAVEKIKNKQHKSHD